jgi:hypothetical protein
LKEFLRKVINQFGHFKKIIALACVIALVTLGVNLSVLNWESSPSPTSSPTPFLSTSPTPIYTSGHVEYPSYGKIYVTGVEIYGGDLQGGKFQWGALYLGNSRNVSFYVHSTSYVPVKLTLSVADWAPSGLDSYLKLSWNYDEKPLLSEQDVFITLTLTSPYTKEFADYLIANDVTSFSFNVQITSTKI